MPPAATQGDDSPAAPMLTIGELARGPGSDSMQSLLDCGITVTSSLRNKAKRIVARA